MKRKDSSESKVSLLAEETRAMLLDCLNKIRHVEERLYGKYVGVEQPLEKPRNTAGNEQSHQEKVHKYLVNRMKGAVDPSVIPDLNSPEIKTELENQLRLQHQLKLEKQNRLESNFNPKPPM